MSKLFTILFQRAFIPLIFISVYGQMHAASAAGLPEEYLLTQRWRTLFSQYSPLNNPANINEENYLTIRGTGTSILGEFLTYDLGVVYPIGLYQSVGVSWLRQGLNESYEETQFNQLTQRYDSTGVMISDNTDYFMGTWSYNIWSGLTIGANIGLIMKQFYDYTAVGISPDIGLNYRVLQHPAVGTHNLGISLHNAFFLSILDKDEAGNKIVNTIPRVLRASLNSSYWERQIESNFDFSFRDIGVSSGDFIDQATKLEWNLDGKVGGWILRIIKVYGLFGIADGSFSYMGIGGGVNIPMINNGRDLTFMMQYISINEVEDKSPASWMSLYVKADIGKHREEIYARKMAKLANLQPNDLYIKACNLYAQENYWDAFFIFSQLFVEYPDFFKNDWVGFFLGSCQEQMDMRLTAEEAFKKMKEMFPRSAAVPFADLGLMRVYYRDGNFSNVEAQFNELNRLGVPDSIKYHGYYYMGETEMKKGSYSKAIQLFDLIPETHPDFVFAQHSSAICNAATDNFEGAISNLENSIQAQVTADAQKEIVNRSYVFIGYIFYEELTEQEGPLAKAVTAFRMVPKSSYFYVDALLGLGWTALKARQWNDCKNAGAEIQSTSDNVVMKAEGALLQSYAFMMEKNYNAAATLLAGASKDLEGYQAPAQQELMSRQDESNALRSRYTDVARKAYDLGTSRQSGFVLKQIDSLHTHQKDIKSKIDDFLKYVDNFERGTFFSRNYESIKEDIDYALAKSQKLGGQVQLQKEVQEMKSKQGQIDKQMEELQRQLQEEEAKAAKKESQKEEKKEEKKQQKKDKESNSVAPDEPSPLLDDDMMLDDLPDEGSWEE
ncbi:MAG: hypothetical protein JW863_19095 [Chitinispirillaceae bacterium]|nr:hypothetical protein [Chitinispirillaceae bacterium]